MTGGKSAFLVAFRQSSAAASIVGVGVVIEAAGIVKQREKTHHRRITPFRRRELQSVAFHAELVGEAVDPVGSGWERIEYAIQQGFGDDGVLEADSRGCCVTSAIQLPSSLGHLVGFYKSSAQSTISRFSDIRPNCFNLS